ncbi:hypothetical protein P4048_27470 [Pseudomonas aeruginosa]|nr:hypothetical protein [Pseudomonas aeruginosa]
MERTVDDNYDDLFQLDPDSIDQYTRKVYGFKSGDSYVQEKMQGDVTWTVTEIKHKYLRAFHYILRNYELDFPNAGGFWAMKMEGDDVQPLLDFIKKSAEHDENVISDLCSKRFPLSVIGKLWNKNTVKVSDMVRSFKGEIFTCIGTAEEREKAYEKINDFSKNGIVLDSYTAWVASIPSILNALKKSYKKIIVARSTIVELLHLCEELKGAAGSSLSVGWSNGQFHRTVTTDEERDALIADIRGRVKNLEDSCVVETYDFPESVDQISDQILEQLGSEVLEPYFIATKNQAVFISDDFCSRDFAKGLFNLDASAWLQPLLDVAGSRGLIDLNEYCACLVDLARYRHSHLAIVPKALERVYQNDSSNGLYEFAALARYIGIKNADIQSHYRVTESFLAMRWMEDVTPINNPSALSLLEISASDEHPDIKAMKATSILLENFVRIPSGVNLVRRLASIPALRLKNYIFGWLKGHFLLARK